jgi:hypothetical protein
MRVPTKGASHLPPPSKRERKSAPPGSYSLAHCRPDNRSFAERMMSRFGWEEGKGLGAQESGMTKRFRVSVGSLLEASGPEREAKTHSDEGPDEGCVARKSRV